MKPGRKAGYTHSEATRKKMSETRKKSPKVKAHLKRLHIFLRGKPPSAAAIAGSKATHRLKRMGLKRDDNIDLWERFRDMFLRKMEATV